MAWLPLLAAAAAMVATAAVGTTGPMVFSSVGREEWVEEEVAGEVWAVLVAGSNGWFNYRHQADVCHAYQILHKHGIPDDHIIVMMYDDIAHNEQNPTPGQIINRPGGPNVYQGVPKDYTGVDVTPENFLKVLSGDSAGLSGVGSGKVLASGPRDRVFINMVDHGAPGIFAFPNEFLEATNLTDALLALHRHKKYHQLVLYVESCESGSLFENQLPDDIEVYALSASSPNQHSYACYLDEELMTFLGDVFSVKWMEDSDMEDLHQETLRKQYHLVRRRVTTSTVMHWGQLRLGGQKLSRFLGNKKLPKPQSRPTSNVQSPSISYNDPCLNSSIASIDVPLGLMQTQLRRATSEPAKSYWSRRLKELKINRLFLKTVMWKVLVAVTEDRAMASTMMHSSHSHAITRWPCYTASVRAFHHRCFNIAHNPYATRLLFALLNLCQHGHTAHDIAAAMQRVCVHGAFPSVL